MEPLSVSDNLYENYVEFLNESEESLLTHALIVVPGEAEQIRELFFRWALEPENMKTW